ncbi:hypothetical protein GE21DRAFT_1025462 [Neurospora crassa]|nr:hypothetical protein GE21DRAFT_1025462 [Neurospora crassa]
MEEDPSFLFGFFFFFNVPVHITTNATSLFLDWFIHDSCRYVFDNKGLPSSLPAALHSSASVSAPVVNLGGLLHLCHHHHPETLWVSDFVTLSFKEVPLFYRRGGGRSLSRRPHPSS